MRSCKNIHSNQYKRSRFHRPRFSCAGAKPTPISELISIAAFQLCEHITQSVNYHSSLTMQTKPLRKQSHNSRTLFPPRTAPGNTFHFMADRGGPSYLATKMLAKLRKTFFYTYCFHKLTITKKSQAKHVAAVNSARD